MTCGISRSRNEKNSSVSAIRRPAGVSAPSTSTPSAAWRSQRRSSGSRLIDASYQTSLSSRYWSRRPPGSRSREMRWTCVEVADGAGDGGGADLQALGQLGRRQPAGVLGQQRGEHARGHARDAAVHQRRGEALDEPRDRFIVPDHATSLQIVQKFHKF